MVSPTFYPLLVGVRNQLIVSCVLVAVAFAILILRIVSRTVTGTRLWWDDYFALIAMPFGVGLLILQILTSLAGNGYPLVIISHDNVDTVVFIRQLVIALELVYSFGLCFAKLSMLFLYLRFLLENPYRICAKITVALVVLWTIGNVLQAFLLCRPFSLEYAAFLPDDVAQSQCGDQAASYRAISIFSVITDVVIIILPLPILLQSTLKTGQKAGLIFIFIAGLSATIAAAARIVYLDRTQVSGDFTATMSDSIFLTTLEPNLAIICASAPMLGPLCRKWFSKEPAYTPQRNADPDFGSRHLFGRMEERDFRDPLSEDKTFQSSWTMFADTEPTPLLPAVQRRGRGLFTYRLSSGFIVEERPEQDVSLLTIGQEILQTHLYSK